jgi:hypothetical protein
MTRKAQRSKKPWHHHLHDYFFPHERNAYRPHFFSVWSISVIAIGLLVIQGAYLAQTRLVFTNTNFLASVLPSVLVDLTNEDRTENALSPVEYDARLENAAQLAVNDMASKSYFAHNSPDGKTPWYWLKQVGYPYTYAGQNLAVNFSDSQDVENAWLNSPTHRANIMKPEFTRIGIATAKGTYKGEEVIFVVQFFATPRADTVAKAVAAAPRTVALNDTPAAPSPSQPQTPTQPGTSEQTVASEPTPASTTAVLGAADPSEVTINAVPHESSVWERLAVSPHRVLLIVLTALMATIIVLLGIAIGTHLRRQYVEVIGGGFALLALITVMILSSSLQRVEVPTDGAGSTVETTRPA